MKKKQLNPYYDDTYFESHDVLDEHLSYTIAQLLQKNKFTTVIDVGCGTGQLVQYLQKKGYKAYGCEPSPAACVRAKKITKKGTIYKTGAEKLPFKDNSINMVCAISVIEHLTEDEVDLFLSEAKRVLTHDGILFLVTPNFATIWRTIQGKTWFGYSDPTHINFFTPHSLVQRLTNYGFTSPTFQFETLIDPPYSWELPGVLQLLPKKMKQLLTYLLISSPFWRIRNSFWLSVRNPLPPPSCTICHQDTSFLFQFIKNGTPHRYYRCPQCELIFISPLPTRKSKKLLHHTDLYTHAVRTNPQFAVIDKSWGGKTVIRWYSALCTWVRKRSVLRYQKQGKLLDIGCGDGEFLQTFSQNKWQCAGVELSPHLSQIAQKKTHALIHEGAIEKIKLPTRSYDVVTLWHVFEHLEKPEKIITKLNHIIQPNGYLILEVPHGEALYRKICGPHWQSLIPPEHLYLWTEKSLNLVLRLHGFSIIRMSYTGVLSFSGASSIANWLRHKNIPSEIATFTAFILFPFVILTNMLFVKHRENIQVVAQKCEW